MRLLDLNRYRMIFRLREVDMNKYEALIELRRICESPLLDLALRSRIIKVLEVLEKDVVLVVKTGQSFGKSANIGRELLKITEAESEDK